MSIARPIAIIMRSKDEWPYVARVFEALKSQTRQDYTLYNIDSGSTDGTWECVVRNNPKSDHIIRIAPYDYVPGPVLNRMIGMTSEPIIVFLNSDAVPLDNAWLENLVRPIENGAVDGTLAVQRARPSAYFIVKDDYLRAYDARRYEQKELDQFAAVCCAFKRSLWERTKFPSKGLAEDFAWFLTCKASGARFKMVGEAIVEHSHNYTFGQLFKRRYQEGITFGIIGSEPTGLFFQVYRAVREIVRDLWRALRFGAILTIPYNIAYRIVTHAGYYLGKREGLRQKASGGGDHCEEE